MNIKPLVIKKHVNLQSINELQFSSWASLLGICLRGLKTQLLSNYFFTATGNVHYNVFVFVVALIIIIIIMF